MSAAIELNAVQKSFGNVSIIRDLNLSVAQGRAPRHHRPQRRRQVDDVQPDQRPHRADRGRDPAERRRHLRPAAVRDQPARPVALLPGHQRLCPHDRVGEYPLRRAVGDRPSLRVLEERRRLAGGEASAPREILDDIHLSHRRDVPAGLLTYAEQRALEIGITIAGGADVILLDEPTAGMSHAETERAVALIRRLTEGRTLVIVEHDMSVVFGLADRISVLVYGQIIASGTPEEIRGNPKVKEAYLGEEAH